ncbi:MAG TPA: hypothetical protein VGO00_12215, partial [Kofleriaceae bacterium]|nr:hypothetical protein [Kofleriaceae bacterium]
MTKLGLAIAFAAAACGNTTKADPAAGSGSATPVATPVVDPAKNKVDLAKVAAKPGAEFIEDAKLLYRVAACGDREQPLPAELGAGDSKKADKIAAIVTAHCKSVLDRIGEFRKTYFEKGRAWFDGVVPKDTKTVVYPFGGGDLLSALVAFPDATEVTTISLEQAGDPRRLRSLSPGQLEGSLGALRVEIGGLVSVGSNTSENLSKQQRNDLPGQVSSFLLGLVAGGFEPVSMRYFTINDDGTLHYLDQAEIDTMDTAAKAHRPKSLKHDWMSPNFSEAFANVEIEYRKKGETATRVHRHIGWNLSDDYMNKHPALLKHLVSKGQVAMLTKGASYLLWSPNFGVIR